LLDGMRDLIVSSIGRSVELVLDPGENLPPALADPNQLELALLNLCVNARDAMPGGGRLTMGADLEEGAAGVVPGLAPGPYVRLSVVDDGEGMDEATLARAVEPFYSTKEVGKGTGLGLSMVHGLASQLGGGFRLSSVVGQGTRADLWLPLAAEPTAQVRAGGSEAPGAKTPALSILVVDDEELVRSATAEMLRAQGHRVITAFSGPQALERLGEADVVVTDYKMPGMNGAELAERVHALRPEMPVLLITGYTGPAEEAPALPRLDKPFRAVELAGAVAELVRPSTGSRGGDAPTLTATAIGKGRAR
jgi:CheY-like chemotaxis protein